MKLTLIVFFSFFWIENAAAFIPKPTTILTKASENAGAGVYFIEQEVSFQTTGEPFVLNETWTVENAEKMKLIVTGTKELKDKLRWVFTYDHGQRTQFISGTKQSKKIDSTFIERYLHVRKATEFQQYLIQAQAVPASLFTKAPYKPGSKDPDIVSDPHLRLARVGGVITYAFGKLAMSPSESAASFFFEQDAFTLRKFRIGNAEISADKFSNFARGLVFPRTRNVKWNENVILIQTQQITPRSEKTISLTPEHSSENDLTESGSAKATIEEFYKRFR